MRTRMLRSWRQANADWWIDLDQRCFPKDQDVRANGTAYKHWVLEDDVDLIGYASLYLDEDVAHFSRCGILPNRRGAGLQRLLIEARVKWCRRRGLRMIRTYTVPENHASIRNLEACGFRKRRSPSGEYIRFTLNLKKAK